MTVPIGEFGKDHWSTFGYLESRCVDCGGVVAIEKMRCDADRHPGLAHMGCDKKYPTILRGGRELSDHDDWDCVDDLEAAGLLVQVGTGVNPRVRLTGYGWNIAGCLREHKAGGRAFAEFGV